MNDIAQLWIGGLLISFGVICLLIKKSSFVINIHKKGYSKVKKWLRKRKSSVLIFFIWIFFTSGTIIIMNGLFVLCKTKNVEFESVLGYNETQLMLATILPAVIIAIFQYRIQDGLNKQNNALIKKQEYLHQNELRSEQIKKIIEFLEFKITGISLAINRTEEERLNLDFDVALEEFSEYNYCIVISNMKNKYLFPSYFNNGLNGNKAEIDIGLQYNSKSLNPKKEYKYIINEKDLKIFIKEDVKRKKTFWKFFGVPTYKNIKKRKEEKINCNIRVKGEDKCTVISDLENKKPKRKEKFLDLDFTINLSLCPESGYKEGGIFVIGVEKMSIEKNKKENAYGNRNF